MSKVLVVVLYLHPRHHDTLWYCIRLYVASFPPLTIEKQFVPDDLGAVLKARVNIAACF